MREHDIVSDTVTALEQQIEQRKERLSRQTTPLNTLRKGWTLEVPPGEVLADLEGLEVDELSICQVKRRKEWGLGR